MASFLNKAKTKAEELMSKTDKRSDNTESDNYGQYSSGAGNKIDPTMDSDLDNRNNPSSRVGGYGTTQADDSYGQTQGYGATSTDTYGSGTNNPTYDNVQSGSAGPHSSSMANKLDPRVDSDRDGRSDPSSRVGGYGNTQQSDQFGQTGGAAGLGSTDTGYGSGQYGAAPAHHSTTHTGAGLGTTGTTGAGYGSTTDTGYGTTGATGAGYGSTTDTGYGDSSYDSSNTGPRRSNLANKLDPRVDSDMDSSNDPTSRTGGYGQTQTGYGGDNYSSGVGGTTTSGGYGGNTGYAGGDSTGYNDPQSYSAGPHSSNMANKMDPRVDSDYDGRNDPTSRTGGYGQTQTSGYTGADSMGAGAGTVGSMHTIQPQAGQHYTGEEGGSGRYGDSAYTSGDGNASGTAGPHKSNLMNKLDPRVDSDLDGSKTYGGSTNTY